ncbi:unnamed protein product [Ascophyllum nodosum]
MASLTPQLLASAIARVMSLDSRAEVDTALPAGDIFNRPDANVLVFVDGLRPEGSKSTPFIADRFQEPTAAYFLRTPTDNTWTSGLQTALGESFDVVEAAGSKGVKMVCAAVDPHLFHSDACSHGGGAEIAMPEEKSKAALWEAEANLGPGVVVDTSTGLRILSLNGGGKEDGEVLDQNVEADSRLVEELNFLSLLPEMLSREDSSREQSSSQPLVVMYLSSLKAIKKTYGEKSAKATQAFKALDASLAEFFDAMSVGSGRRLTSQFVVGPALAERLAVGGRRLGASGSDNSTSAENVTLVDIVQYQLNLWTGVGLAFMAFLAVYATMNMDVQPDSLLYAKFIADTSGGGLKTD